MAVFWTNNLPGRTVQIQNGKEYLWVSGTDYLGMAYNAEFRSFLEEGLSTYGTHFGSSRNNSLRLTIYHEAEEQFANWQESESALLVSSGMLAGQIVMREIENIIFAIDKPEKITYHYAPRAHPALWGNQYAANNNINWTTWAQQTVAELNADHSDNLHLICSDAVGSPLVEELDFSIFNGITNPEKCRLIIDQSHSLGVLGEGGNGVKDQLNTSIRSRTLFLSSLNKALGIPAGMIWGTKDVIEHIAKSPWFTGASPSAPVYIAAFKNLLERNIYTKAHHDLYQNIAYFNALLETPEAHFEVVNHYPVYCYRKAVLFDFLFENGIMASCFSYPLPSDLPVTRIVVTAAHQKKDLDYLAEVCIRFRN